MVSAALPAAQTAKPRRQLPAWLEIAKPRLIPLLLATTLGGMAVADDWPCHGSTIALTLLGGTLASAAAGILNCLWEQDLDGRMQRTSGRALPSGRLAQNVALSMAVVLTVIAVLVLCLGVNALAASLTLLGLCSYVLLYTALLKPRTSQNIVIGGVAGAIPPLVGVAAVNGHLSLAAWWLFALVMVWTPAHFWALALLLRDDYRAVGIPMLPVVKGVGVTVRAIRSYAWLTVALSLGGIVLLPSGGWLYGLLLIPFNTRLLQQCHRLMQQPEDPAAARGMFRWSIFYLFGICLLLLLARTPQAQVTGLQPLLALLLPTGSL